MVGKMIDKVACNAESNQVHFAGCVVLCNQAALSKATDKPECRHFWLSANTYYNSDQVN
jgi:hypothetical protein